MSKSIRLSEGAYERLAAHKREDETSSDVVLRLAGELQNDGASVGDGNVTIGATAAVVEEPVLTRNVTDFEGAVTASQ